MSAISSYTTVNDIADGDVLLGLQSGGSTADTFGLGNTGDCFTIAPDLQGSSGTDTAFVVASTVNQSGTAAYTVLKVDATETTTGSGTKLLQDWQVGGSSVAQMTKAGRLLAESVRDTGDAWGIVLNSNNVFVGDAVNQNTGVLTTVSGTNRVNTVVSGNTVMSAQPTLVRLYSAGSIRAEVSESGTADDLTLIAYLDDGGGGFTAKRLRVLAANTNPGAADRAVVIDA